MNSFQAFRLQSSILKGLKKHAVLSPSAEQKTIFKAVAGQNDLVINATPEMHPEVGYLLAALNDAASQHRRGGTKILILTKDLERAASLTEWINQIAEFAQLKAVFLSPDQDEKESVKTLASGPTVLISTPAYFGPVLESVKMVFREVSLFVIEKAEELEDWGVVEGISRRILSTCQRIFIASRDSRELRAAEKSILSNPELVKASPERSAPEAPPVPKDLTQYYINVPPRSKITTLTALLKESSLRSNLIFAASGRTADKLYKALRKNDFRAVSLHKELDKETYEKRLDLFTSHKVQNLIAGDFSAADLDVTEVQQVINYDVPEDVNEYKLRADLVKDGKATKILSLVSKQDRSDILSICEELGYAPEELPVPEAVLQKLAEKTGGGDRSGTTGSSDKSDKSDKSGSSSKSSKAGSSSKSRSASKSGSSGKESQKGSKKSKGGRGSSRSGSKSVRPGKTSRRDGRSRTNHANVNKIDVSALPQPTFEQLSGGRAGKKDKKKKPGLLDRLKKMFGGD